MKNAKILWFLLLGLAFNSQAQQFIRDYQGYYGYTSDDGRNNAIATTASGGYFMAIEHEGNLGTQDALTFQLLDSDMKMVWRRDARTISGAGVVATTIQVRDVIQTTDGGFAVGGFMEYEAPGGAFVFRGAFLIKTDSDGAITWMKRYPAAQIHTVMGIEEHNGGYILVGKIDETNDRGVIVWTNSLGTPVNAKRLFDSSLEYGLLGFFAFNDIVRISENEYAAVGSTSELGEFARLALVKFDSTGVINDFWLYYQPQNKLLNKGYSLYGHAIDYNEALDQFVIAGHAQSKTAGVCTVSDYDDALIMNVDATSGNANWTKRYDAFVPTMMGKGVCWNGNNIGVVGQVETTTFSPISNDDAFFITTDANGHVTKSLLYGNSEDDDLRQIKTTLSGDYISSGIGLDNTLISPWVVETYDNPLESCNSAIFTPTIVNESVSRLNGYSEPFFVTSYIDGMTSILLDTRFSLPCPKAPVCQVTDVDFSNTPTLGMWYGTNFNDASSGNAYTTISAWDWNFGDGNIGSGNPGYNDYQYAAMYTVCLTATGIAVNGEECYASTCKRIQIGTGIDPVRGFRSAGENNTFLVSPNPMKNSARIQGTLSNEAQLLEVYLLDASGRKVKNIHFEDEGSSVDLTFDASDLTMGIYTCMIVSTDGIQTISLKK